MKGFLHWQKDIGLPKTALTEALTEKDKGMHLLGSVRGVDPAENCFQGFGQGSGFLGVSSAGTPNQE
jgi:hypothetical protein